MPISDWSSDVCSSDLLALSKQCIRSYVSARRISVVGGNAAELTVRWPQNTMPGDCRGRETDSGETAIRSEEHTSELQSLMRISYAVFCLNIKKITEVAKPIMITVTCLLCRDNHEHHRT